MGSNMGVFKSWRSYWDFAHAIKHEFRYFRDPASNEFLQAVRETARAERRTLRRTGAVACAARPLLARRTIQNANRMNRLDIREGMTRKASRVRGLSYQPVRECQGHPVLYLSNTGIPLAEVRPGLVRLASSSDITGAAEVDLTSAARPSFEGYCGRFRQRARLKQMTLA